MISVILLERVGRQTFTMSAPLCDLHGRAHRYLRISLTDQCNFRCSYCMPAEGYEWERKENLLSDDEIIRLTEIFARMGVNKVRLTGGEPTLRQDLETLISRLVAVDGIEMVAMTTNGSTLSKRAQSYRDAGLNVLNISLDSLNQERFKRITRRDQLELILWGINSAYEAGFDELKINVVVMKGVNEGELLDFVQLTEDLAVTVRFIEFMPFMGNRWSEASLYPYADMRRDIEQVHPLVRVSTEASAVGKDFFVPGFKGKVGFVTSMTETFCGDCDRVRLTADGAVKPCLFSPAEVSLRDELRSGAGDEELTEMIRAAMTKKPKEHRPMIQLATIQSRSMTQIGG